MQVTDKGKGLQSPGLKCLPQVTKRSLKKQTKLYLLFNTFIVCFSLLCSSHIIKCTLLKWAVEWFYIFTRLSNHNQSDIGYGNQYGNSIQIFSSPLLEKSCTHQWSLPILIPPHTWKPLIYFLSLCIYLLWTFYINGII